MRRGRLCSLSWCFPAVSYLLIMLMVSLSPSVWSRSILPELCALDKGVYLKIEPLVLDFKLVMEMASDARSSSVKTQMPHLCRSPSGALGTSY
jgi:hypothetical protein